MKTKIYYKHRINLQKKKVVYIIQIISFCQRSFISLKIIEIQLIYNVVLVSGVQQRDSVVQICVCVCVCMYIYIYILFHHRFLQDIEYHFYATQKVLACYLFFIQQCVHFPTPVFLPGESQGRGSLVGRRLWGHTVRHD